MEAFEMRIWRRTEISWTEHISNEVLKLVEEDNKNETTELDATYNERGRTSKRNTKRKNGGYKRKGKTKAKITGLDDERGIQQT